MAVENDWGLVTIGVPTFNRPQTLKRALDCLVNQTYSNLEIIVSDNASTDVGVKLVLDSFRADKRIQIVQHLENRGSVFNFNFVLAQAKGDFFMRLADDDWIDVDYIEKCLNFLHHHNDYAACYGLTKLHKSDFEFSHYDVHLSMDEENNYERLTHFYRNVAHNGAYYGLFRKAIASYSKAKRELADDWLVVARIAFTGKFKMLPDTHAHITLGGVSNSINSIVTTLKLSSFNRNFPYLSIAINVAMDIIHGCKVYRAFSLGKRIKLAKDCFKIIYVKFNVRNEINLNYKRRQGYKSYLL